MADTKPILRMLPFFQRGSIEMSAKHGYCSTGRLISVFSQCVNRVLFGLGPLFRTSEEVVLSVSLSISDRYIPH
ncbi:hypothetical protein, partial [Nitratireductor luteus]|uniref:hypothetical protein n=1 Tax=Nitratireductor luteus TaxID=2976980 RepID=UPI002240ABC4